MARDLTSGMEIAVQAEHVRVAVLVDAVFGSGTVHVWSGLGDLEWNGDAYQGTGELGSISSITETSDLRAEGIVITLGGLDPDLISIGLQEVAIANEVMVWLAQLDAAGAVIADPYLAWQGYMDVPVITEGAETASISITCESIGAMRGPRNRLYTDADQQHDHPGDLALQFVTNTVSTKWWAVSRLGPPADTGSSGGGGIGGGPFQHGF